MNHSILWARLLGLYMVLLTVGVLMNIEAYQQLIETLAENLALTMTMGVFTLFLGLIIVVTHSVWRGWPIIVTILGYWITLKGIFLLSFPQYVSAIAAGWQDVNWYLLPLPTLFLGLILLYFGFFHGNDEV